MKEYVDIVFDGPPGPQPPRFIEVEDSAGNSIKFGDWIERDDGDWVLRIKRAPRVHPVGNVNYRVKPVEGI